MRGGSDIVMNHVQTLTRYKSWADRLMLDAVAALPEPARSMPQPIVFGSIIRTLHHVYAMDRVWQAHLLGVPHGYTTRNPERHLPFDELRAMQSEIDAWYVRYADSLDAQSLEQLVGFTFIGGGHGTMSRNDMVLHVVNHATYHRGHVADMLYHLSIAPPTTDLPVFLKERATGAA
jgi:uncharacterized damage-inducible protein DinB